MRSPPRKDSAFTLIELLVVITLIAIMIALLLPALQTARGSAQTIKNLASMRQIQMALFHYAGDHHDALIVGRLDGDPLISYVNWPGILVDRSYITDPFVFWGPMRDTAWLEPLRPGIRANPRYAPEYFWSGYALNHYGAYVSEKAIIQYDVSPRNLRRASNVPPSKLLSMTEMVDLDRYTSVYGFIDGRCLAEICGNSGITALNLFTWRSAAARTYLDGHAISRAATDLGYHASDSRHGDWINYGFTYSIREPWYDLRAPSGENL